jgi:hypothetical protein
MLDGFPNLDLRKPGYLEALANTGRLKPSGTVGFLERLKNFGCYPLEFILFENPVNIGVHVGGCRDFVFFTKEGIRRCRKGFALAGENLTGIHRKSRD